MLKALDMSCATARIAPYHFKPLAIISDGTVTRAAVEREGLKPH